MAATAMAHTIIDLAIDEDERFTTFSESLIVARATSSDAALSSL